MRGPLSIWITSAAFLSAASAQDATRTIDVLVLYSPGAEVEFAARDKDVVKEIQYVELAQNQIFQNSGVDARIRIFANGGMNSTKRVISPMN